MRGTLDSEDTGYATLVERESIAEQHKRLKCHGLGLQHNAGQQAKL